MSDLVSVVVPVYNTEQVLERCLSSLVNQSYKQIEILLIDDGSTDNSGTICDEYAKKDSRVKAFHSVNLGAAHARNVGVDKAKGRYITFVDSDDYIEDKMIESLMDDIAMNDSDLSVSSLTEEDDSECFCISIEEENKEKILFLSQKYLIFGPTQKMYKTEIAKKTKFPEDVRYGEDLLFNIEYLKKIKSVSYQNKCFYHYCRNNNGLSTKNRWDMFDNDMFLHKALLEWYVDIGIFDGKVKEFLYDRVFDTAVNSIGLTFRKDCPFNFSETRQLVDRIVSDDMVQESIEYADVNKYASWQAYLIKNKNSFILSAIALMERMFNE